MIQQRITQRLAIVAVAILVVACAGEDGSGGEKISDFDMLLNYSDNIIIPTYREVNETAGLLAGDEGAVQAYCDAIDSANESVALQQAQSLWRDVMTLWQQAEYFQFGPAAVNDSTLHKEVYTWGDNGNPSTCGVDQSVVLLENDPAFSLLSRSVRQRGLDALEYLLFNSNLDHSCSAGISGVEDWNAQSDLEKKQQRCAYARIVADRITFATQGLYDGWRRVEGNPESNYRDFFLTPPQAANSIKALSDGLFYLDVTVKDLKMGLPTGLNIDCAATSCPESVEAPYSGESIKHILDNLNAFKTLFTGGSGLGFDDMLSNHGHERIVTRINALLDQAIENFSAFDSDLAVAVTGLDAAACVNSAANPVLDRNVEVCALYGDLKRITDELKTDFVMAVNLDLPTSAQGDGD